MLYSEIIAIYSWMETEQKYAPLAELRVFLMLMLVVHNATMGLSTVNVQLFLP